MLYHSANDVFIGYCIAAYIILSITSAPFLLGYAVYKVVNKIKGRRKGKNVLSSGKQEESAL